MVIRILLARENVALNVLLRCTQLDRKT